MITASIHRMDDYQGWWGGLPAPTMPSAVLSTQGWPHEGRIISASLCLAMDFSRVTSPAKMTCFEWPWREGQQNSIKGHGHTDSTLQEELHVGGWGWGSANAGYWGQRQRRRNLARRSLSESSCEKDKYMCSTTSTWGWSAWYNRGSSLTMMHRTPGCMITASPSSTLQREGKQDINFEFSSLFCFSQTLLNLSLTGHKTHSYSTTYDLYNFELINLSLIFPSCMWNP